MYDNQGVWQGGGLHIDGTATLTNNNVYDNQAVLVCSSSEHFLSFYQSPRWNVTYAHGWQDGGGLIIWGTATLTNTNVFENQAGDVCSPFELFVRTLLLVPCAGTYVACAHGWQDGGGLYIDGTATLTNTNVHANRAADVCLLSEHVSPPAELT